MANSTWQDLILSAYDACRKTRHVSPVVMGTRSNTNVQILRRSLKRTLITLGFGLACFTVALQDSWTNNSPLLNVIGSGVCLPFLVIFWITGGLWWLLTGSKIILLWAKGLFPWCIQPYRSAAAISIVFMLLALFFPAALRAAGRFLWFEKHRQTILEWLRLIVVSLTIFFWLATVWYFIKRPVKPPQRPPAPQKQQYHETRQWHY